MNRFSRIMIRLSNEERGSVLLLCIFMLVILTVIGFALSRTATQEIRLSANERDYQRALYAAESGVAHMRAQLESGLLAGNQVNIAVGDDSDWDFALNPILSFTAGLDSYTYTVTVINNDDGGSPTNDIDGLILIRSVGTGPNNSTATVEVLVQAELSTDNKNTNDYNSQAGGGSGKSHTANDSGAVSDTPIVKVGN